MYRDKNSGLRLFNIPSIDFSIIAAMFLLVALAWGVSKMERTFIKVEKVKPEFTISREISVSPVIETKTKKEAEKIGKFMSLAKTEVRPAVKNAAREQVNDAALNNIVLSHGFPAASQITAPRIIYKTMPDYPVKAVEAGYSGTVSIKVYILKNGRVGSAMIERSSGYEILDSSALSAVSLWIFEPALYSRDATEAWFKVPVKFQLKS